MTDVITVNRGSRMATLLRWSTKNIISRSQSQWIKITLKIEYQTFAAGTCVLTSHHTVSTALPTELRDRRQWIVKKNRFVYHYFQR